MNVTDVHSPRTLVSGQSLAAAFDSEAIDVREYRNVGIQIVTAGVTTNVGSWAVEASLDGTSWTALDITLADLEGANTTYFVALADIPTAFLRVVFTSPGGSANGTCTIKYHLCGRQA